MFIKYFIILPLCLFSTVKSEEYTVKILNFTDFLKDNSEQVEKENYVEFYHLINNNLNKPEFYDGKLNTLVYAYHELNKIGTKNAMLTACYLKNVIIWNMVYNIIQGNENSEFYKNISDSIKINPSKLSIFYGDKDLVIQNASEFEEYFLNIVSSNSAVLQDVNDLAEIKKHGIRIVGANIKTFVDTLDSNNNFEYISRILLIEKLLEVNFNMFIDFVYGGILFIDSESTEKNIIDQVNNNNVLYKDYVFNILNIEIVTLMDCYAMLYSGYKNILKFKPLIL